MPVTISSLNPWPEKTVQSESSQTPTLQVDRSFQPSESDACLLNCLRSSGIWVGSISTVLRSPSRLECSVEVASRGYEHGDVMSCGAADAYGGAKPATITQLNVRSGWIFMVIVVVLQLTKFRQSSSSALIIVTSTHNHTTNVANLSTTPHTQNQAFSCYRTSAKTNVHAQVS